MIPFGPRSGQQVSLFGELAKSTPPRREQKRPARMAREQAFTVRAESFPLRWRTGHLLADVAEVAVRFVSRDTR